jgi:two-component sensor histidine kinase
VEEFPQATRIKVATTYQQLGNSYLQFEQPDSALANFERTLRLSEQMNNRITIPVLHLSMAKAYRMKGDWARAEHHVVTGLKYAQGVSVLHTSSLYAFGVELYEHLGQSDKALFFAKKHDQLDDSISRNEDAMAMIRFQAQFESAKKERELEAARLVVRNRTITLVSLAVVTTLSIGFMGVLYIQRRKIQQQNSKLTESNAEQKALMQEVHHRVKNNLQYIVSLLSLQAQNVESTELAQQIEEIKTRIMTMGLIHQRLYQTHGVQAVHLPSFLQELVDNLLQAHSSRMPVTKHLAIDPIRLDVESAIALGLLVNEVTTNAVKHAFANHHAPKFALEVTREKEGIRVRVSDNGPGFSVRQSVGMGFGMRLIELLLRKLKGTLHQVNPNTIDIYMTGLGVVG